MAQTNRKWEEAYQDDWLKHPKSNFALFGTLHQGEKWFLEIFTRGAESQFLFRGEMLGNTRVYLITKAEYRSRYELPGNEDVLERIDALENIGDDDLAFWPENPRNDALPLAKFKANTNYALRLTDLDDNMERLNFDQKAALPESVTIYTASAGAQGRRLYCFYQ